MAMDFGATVLADVANIALHFLFPFKQHDHSCFCLLCSNTERQAQRQECKRLQSASLIPTPTSTDLDLVRTESSSVRQLVVFDAETSTSLTEFVTQLKNYLHFHVMFNAMPKITVMSQAVSCPPFHILTVLSRNLLTFELREWVQHVVREGFVKRLVLICPCTEPLFSKPPMRVTCIRFNDYVTTLRALTHGMMVTHQRLMPKDVHRFLKTESGTTCTQQQGFCLFF